MFQIHKIGYIHQITIDESMFVDGMMNMIYYNEMFDAFSVEVYSPLNSIYTKCKNYSQTLMTGLSATKACSYLKSAILPKI